MNNTVVLGGEGSLVTRLDGICTLTTVIDGDAYIEAGVIDGECALTTTIDGTCSLSEVVDGIAKDVYRVAGLDYYDGDYTVTPLADEAVVLQTYQKAMADNVTVLKVPYFETSNTSGITVYIAGEVS